MMRSILLDRSLHFFKILEYDKCEWLNFWKSRYRKSFPKVLPLYEKKHDLNDERIGKILSSFKRSFLDRLKNKIESQLREYKRKALNRMSEISEYLRLDEEDFHMMVLTLLGLEKSTFIRTERKGLVVLIDPLALEIEGQFHRFDDVVLESAKNARKMLDEKKES